MSKYVFLIKHFALLKKIEISGCKTRHRSKTERDIGSFFDIAIHVLMHRWHVFPPELRMIILTPQKA